MPNVFFSDSTGPCYHTAQDEYGVVDFWKLDQQVKIAYRVAMSLVEGRTAPDVLADQPARDLRRRALAAGGRRTPPRATWLRFTAAQQQQLTKFRDDLNAIVAAGAANFGADDIDVVVSGAATAVSILTSGSVRRLHLASTDPPARIRSRGQRAAVREVHGLVEEVRRLQEDLVAVVVRDVALALVGGEVRRGRPAAFASFCVLTAHW